jgi:serine/threonine protein kinase/Tol biopolymer transport system component
MNPPNPQRVLAACPSQNELAGFNAGKLSFAEIDAIAEHMGSCAQCESALAALGDPPDGLVSQLRQLPADDPLAEEPSIEGEMSAVEQSADSRAEVADSSRVTHESTTAGSSRLREYELRGKLGQGGMGTVYKAMHARLGKFVALKVLASERMNNPEAKARFHREMKAVGRLNHPNIVQATDAGEENGTHFLVMEFIEGIDLAKLVRQCGPLPVAEACELIRQAAVGLDYVHSQRLVHRDVKPSNLLLSSSGQVKVLDLGLALLLESDIGGEATASTMVLGSFDYMAPEQGDDPHTVDARADLYSLGCTLYHLLAGQPPFPAPTYRTPFQKLKAHALAPVTPITAFKSDAPEDLARIVDRLLAKDPAGRFATAAEVALALKPLAADSDLRQLLPFAKQDPELLTADEHKAYSVLPVPQRRPRRLVVVLACLIVAAFGFTAAVAGFRAARGTLDPLEQANAANARPPRVLAPKTVMRGHKGTVYSISFASDGQTLVSASEDKTVRLWDVQRGALRQTLPPHDHAVYCAVLSPDGKVIASASEGPDDGGIRLWDLEANRLSGTLTGHAKGIFDLAFSPDGKWLASAGWDKTVRVWDLATRHERHVLDDGRQPSIIRRVVFFPDGKTLASAGGRVSVWDAETGAQKSSFEHGGTASLKVAPDGGLIAVAKWQAGTITLFDPTNGKSTIKWQAHQSRINDLAFSSKSGLLASTGSDGTVRLWDPAGPRELAVLQGHRGSVYSVAFSPDGRTLATGGDADSAVMLWDVAAFSGRSEEK